MNNEKYKSYIIDLISLLKWQALEAKQDADGPNKENEDFNQGQLMAYYSVFTLLKHQALVFEMDEKELGLANINPDVDLL